MTDTPMPKTEPYWQQREIAAIHKGYEDVLRVPGYVYCPEDGPPYYMVVHSIPREGSAYYFVSYLTDMYALSGYEGNPTFRTLQEAQGALVDLYSRLRTPAAEICEILGEQKIVATPLREVLEGSAWEFDFAWKTLEADFRGLLPISDHLQSFHNLIIWARARRADLEIPNRVNRIREAHFPVIWGR